MWSRTWRACAASRSRRSSFSARFGRRQIRVDRHFRVDDDARVAGELDDEVRRLAAAVLGRDGRLLDEVALLEHAGQLDDAPELEFAPFAAHVGRTQRAAQAVGRRAELFLRLDERSELRRDRAERAFARLVHFDELALDLVERLADRAHEARRRLQKVVAILFQRVARERRERVAQLRVRVRERGALFLGRAPLVGGP